MGVGRYLKGSVLGIMYKIETCWRCCVLETWFNPVRRRFGLLLPSLSGLSAESLSTVLY